jgi:hypothetical protein
MRSTRIFKSKTPWSIFEAFPLTKVSICNRKQYLNAGNGVLVVGRAGVVVEVLKERIVSLAHSNVLWPV